MAEARTDGRSGADGFVGVLKLGAAVLLAGEVLGRRDGVIK